MGKKAILQDYIRRGYDLDFQARTQPQGNPFFTSTYMRNGFGYVSCINIYDYPTDSMNDFWITPMTADSNTVTIVDIGSKDKAEALEESKNAVKEIRSRYSKNNSDFTNDQITIEYNAQRKRMRKLIRGESSKTFNVRIFVYETTHEALDRHVGKIITRLRTFDIQGTIYADELVYDNASIFLPISQQQFLGNHRSPHSITARNLAGGYWFNHTMLDDPYGAYIGKTTTNGQVMFDPWYRTDKRTRSNKIYIGRPGFGKSTLMKKDTESDFARGNKIRIFDIKNEYSDLVQQMGGTIIALDGSQGSINPFQVYPTVTDATGENIDVVGSFSAHIEKLKNMYHFLDSTLDDTALNKLSIYLNDFYVEQGLWVKDARNHLDKIRILGLPNTDYPLLREFQLFLNSKARKSVSDGESLSSQDIIDKLSTATQNMVETYDSIFGSWTTIDHFEEKQVVSFDLSGLKSAGERVFNAQVYAMLTLTWSQALRNGKKQQLKVESGEIKPYQACNYSLVLDEAQNIITPQFPFGADYIAKLEEEMRKSYCGIAFATPSIETILPADSLQESPEYERAIKKIFSNLQYRFFFNLDDSSLDLVAKQLGGSITRAELGNISHLKKRECFLNIAGDHNLTFTVSASHAELARYHGGQ